MIDPYILDSKLGETCVVCDKLVTGGGGYCELLYEDDMFALCCPLCLETFQNKPGYYASIRLLNKALHPPKP